MTFLSLLRDVRNTTWNFLVHPIKLGVYHILKGVKDPRLTLTQRVSHVALGVIECCVPVVNYGVALYENPHFNKSRVAIVKKPLKVLPENSLPKLPDELKYLRMPIPQVELDIKKNEPEISLPQVVVEEKSWVYKAVAISLIFLAITGIVLPLIRTSEVEKSSQDPPAEPVNPHPVKPFLPPKSLIQKINPSTFQLNDDFLWNGNPLNHRDLNPDIIHINALDAENALESISDDYDESTWLEVSINENNSSDLIIEAKSSQNFEQGKIIEDKTQKDQLITSSHSYETEQSIPLYSQDNKSNENVPERVLQQKTEIHPESYAKASFAWLGILTLPIASLFYNLGFSKRKPEGSKTLNTSSGVDIHKISKPSSPKQKQVKRHSDGGVPQLVIFSSTDSPSKSSSTSQPSPTKKTASPKASPKTTPPKIIPPPPPPLPRDKFRVKTEAEINREIADFLDLKGQTPPSLDNYKLPSKERIKIDSSKVVTDASNGKAEELKGKSLALLDELNSKNGKKLELETTKETLSNLENRNEKSQTLAHVLFEKFDAFKTHVESRRNIIKTYNTSLRNETSRDIYLNQLDEWQETYEKLKKELENLHKTFSLILFWNEAVLIPQEKILDYNAKCISLLKIKISELQSQTKEVEKVTTASSSVSAVATDPINKKIESINTWIKDYEIAVRKISELEARKTSEETNLVSARKEYKLTLIDPNTNLRQRKLRVVELHESNIKTCIEKIKEKNEEKNACMQKLKEEIALFSTALNFQALNLSGNEEGDTLVKARHISDCLTNKTVTEIPKAKIRGFASPLKRGSAKNLSSSSTDLLTPPPQRSYRRSNLSKVISRFENNPVDHKKAFEDYVEDFYMEKACAISTANMMKTTIEKRKKRIDELEDSISNLTRLKESIQTQCKNNFNSTSTPQQRYSHTVSDLAKISAELEAIKAERDDHDVYLMYVSNSHTGNIKFRERFKNEAEEYARKQLGLPAPQTTPNAKNPSPNKNGWKEVTYKKSPKPKTPITVASESAPMTPPRLPKDLSTSHAAERINVNSSKALSPSNLLSKTKQSSPRRQGSKEALKNERITPPPAIKKNPIIQTSVVRDVKDSKTPLQILASSNMFEKVKNSPPKRQDSTDAWENEPLSPIVNASPTVEILKQKSPSNEKTSPKVDKEGWRIVTNKKSKKTPPKKLNLNQSILSGISGALANREATLLKFKPQQESKATQPVENEVVKAQESNAENSLSSEGNAPKPVENEVVNVQDLKAKNSSNSEEIATIMHLRKKIGRRRASIHVANDKKSSSKTEDSPLKKSKVKESISSEITDSLCNPSAEDANAVQSVETIVVKSYELNEKNSSHEVENEEKENVNQNSQSVEIDMILSSLKLVNKTHPKKLKKSKSEHSPQKRNRHHTKSNINHSPLRV